MADSLLISHDDYHAVLRESTAMLLVLLRIDDEATECPNGYVVSKPTLQMVRGLINAIESADEEALDALDGDMRRRAMEFIDTMLDVMMRNRDVS